MEVHYGALLAASNGDSTRAAAAMAAEIDEAGQENTMALRSPPEGMLAVAESDPEELDESHSVIDPEDDSAASPDASAASTPKPPGLLGSSQDPSLSSVHRRPGAPSVARPAAAPGSAAAPPSAATPAAPPTPEPMQFVSSLCI